MIRRTLVILLLLTLLALPAIAGAQGSCAHATLRLETTQPVDAAALCDAARPWAEAGFEVFVFVTDEAPSSEADWFDLLDRVEQEAGLASGNQMSRNALAFETSTANLPYATSITVGERLFDTRLEREGDRLKGLIRNGVRSGDVSTGMVAAMEEGFELVNPAPVPGGTTTGPAAQGGGNVLGTLGLGALGLGGAAAAAAGYRRYQRRQDRLGRLRDLEKRVPVLLGALLDLLGGDSPEESLLYEVLVINDGKQHPGFERAVRAIRASQQTLDKAVEIHRDLGDAAKIARLDIEERIGAWELLAATLTGTRPEILSLTDDQLRELLDPWVNLDRSDRSALSTQLDKVRATVSGTPLRFELEKVDTKELDPDGVLGQVERIESLIDELQHAREAAEPTIEQARSALDAGEEGHPDPFEIGRAALYAPIRRRLAEATSKLEEKRYLEAYTAATTATAALGAAREVIEMTNQKRAHLAAARDIYEAGFVPPTRAQDAAAVEAATRALHDALERIAAQPDEIAALAREMRDAALGQLKRAQGWRELHQETAARIARLDARRATIEQGPAPTAAEQYAALGRWPASNWEELATPYHEALETLGAAPQWVEEAEALNRPDLSPQRFDAARDTLDRVAGRLDAAEAIFAAIADRLERLRRLEGTLPGEIDRARTEALQLVELARSAPQKIDPAQIPEIERAAALLDRAARLAAARDLIAASTRYEEGRALATELEQTVQQQVLEYDRLAVRARESVNRARNQIATATSTVSHRLAGGVGRAQLAQAQQALPAPPRGVERRDTLERIVQQAEQVAALAAEAERAARSRIVSRQRPRSGGILMGGMPRGRSSGGFGRSSGGFGGSSGGSRRIGSGGSSRSRGSSMGGRRRL